MNQEIYLAANNEVDWEAAEERFHADDNGSSTDSASVSSAAENIARKRRRGRDRERSQVRVPVPLAPPHETSLVGEFTELPEIQPFDQLVTQYPSIFFQLSEEEVKRMRVKRELVLSDMNRASRAQSSAQDAETKEKAQEEIERCEAAVKGISTKINERVDFQTRLDADRARFQAQIEERKARHSSLVHLLREIETQIPVPRFLLMNHASSAMTQENIKERLRGQLAYFPLFTAQYENELMREAGRFPIAGGQMRNFPPCKNGRTCKANTTQLPGLADLPHPQRPDFILTMIMYPHEYDNFMQTNNAPRDARPCILCHRYILSIHTLHVRRHPHLVQIDNGAVFQLYRNSCDSTDGYFHNYLMIPDSDRYEGFMDMVAAFRRTLLSVNHLGPDADFRRYVDQSAMIYRPPDPPEPYVGESLSDFRLRSKAHWRDVGHRVPLRDPRRALLREMPGIARLTQLSDSLIQRAQKAEADYVKAVAVDSFSYEAALTFDSFWPVYWSLRLKESKIEPIDLRKVPCQENVPDIHYKITRCSLWASLRAKKDKWIHVLSKILPQPCQTRRFQELCNAWFVKDPVFRQDILQWVWCALLGNYHHTRPSERGLPRVRFQLQALIRGESKDYWLKFLQACPGLVIFALREYLWFVVEDDPALLAHLQSLFDWKRFTGVVDQAMSYMRAIIAEELLTHDSAYETLRITEDSPWIQKISRIYKLAHIRILTISYQRPSRPFIDDFIGIARTHLELKKQPENVFLNHALREIEPIHIKVLQELVRRADPIATSFMIDILPFFEHMGCSSSGIKAITRLKSAFDFHQGKKAIRAAVQELLQQEPYAFAILDAYCRIRRNFQWLYVRDLPHTYRAFQLQALQERYSTNEIPEDDLYLYYCEGCRTVYSLVRSFCNEPCVKHRYYWCGVCHLSKQYTFGLDVPLVDYINDELHCRRPHPVFNFDVFCDQLGANRQVDGDNKMATEPVDEEDEKDEEDEDEEDDGKTERKVKPTEVAIEESDNVEVDETLLEKPSKSLHYLIVLAKQAMSRKNAPRQKLSRIDLLGRMVVFKRQLIMLCPQRGCARPMILDTEKCLFNERGYACAHCTFYLRYDERMREKNQANTAAQGKRTCFIDDRSLSQASESICYPRNIYICRKHNLPIIENAVAALMLTNPNATRRQVSTCILDARQQHLAELNERYDKFNKMRLQANRRRDRASKKR